MSKNKEHWDLTENADRDRIGGGPGAADAYSGAGNATGTPDADTAMRAGDAVTRGDVDEDRKRLFPDLDADDANGSADPDNNTSGAVGTNDAPLKNHGDKFESQLPHGRRADADPADNEG